MTARDNDLALTALELAVDIRRLADRIHKVHGVLLAGDLRRAAITVEETYQHLARASEPRRRPPIDLLDGLDRELGSGARSSTPGTSSGGNDWPRRRR